MQKQGPSSYRCTNTEDAVDYLIQNGYRFAQPRSQYEHARCIKGNSLIVLYNNGTVLLQGADTESPRALLDTFQPTDVQIDLPF
jgi:hypothetical protein